MGEPSEKRSPSGVPVSAEAVVKPNLKEFSESTKFVSALVICASALIGTAGGAKTGLGGRGGGAGDVNGSSPQPEAPNAAARRQPMRRTRFMDLKCTKLSAPVKPRRVKFRGVKFGP